MKPLKRIGLVYKFAPDDYRVRIRDVRWHWREVGGVFLTREAAQAYLATLLN